MPLSPCHDRSPSFASGNGHPTGDPDDQPASSLVDVMGCDKPARNAHSIFAIWADKPGSVLRTAVNY